MSAHGLLSSVFSCSSSPEAITKRRLRQTRSLDPALMRHGSEADEVKGNFTWNSVSGRTVGLKPVLLQSLSELERVRLQDVAFRRLLQDHDLRCQITIPKYGYKHKKSLRRKLDSLSKERGKDKDSAPQAFGLPLSQVISNDRTHKQRHDPQPERHSSDMMLPLLHIPSNSKKVSKDLSSSNSSLSSTSETPTESPLPGTMDTAPPRTHRRGGVSVDCITDLDDNQSRLLEALQLSLPLETAGKSKKQQEKKLSLNPIYRQVPRVVDNCCQHLEKYGLETVGIFRVGSSKKRVRQLREEFDQGVEVHLDDEHSVHDVAALLKEFLRDMPDPLLTRELYTAFINTVLLDHLDEDTAIQLLIFLLPPCNSDTLQRLLRLLSTVATHAEDSLDVDGNEITGNKMTSLNLATIFGPNLLHKQKNSDKEFVVETMACAEESTAIITVLQRMIVNYDTLFMVPADLQNEVLMSLLETDPDIVDYLLRRKANQDVGPGFIRSEDSFSLSDRCFSSDSIKASSGEVSPYDNNSPVLSERPCKYREDRFPRLSGQERSSSWDRPHTFSPSLSLDKDAVDVCNECRKVSESSHLCSPEDVSQCESNVLDRLSGGLSNHQGSNKLPVRPTQTSLDVREYRPHLRLSRSTNIPHAPRGQRQPDSLLHQGLCGQSVVFNSDDFAGRTGHPEWMETEPLHFSRPQTCTPHNGPPLTTFQPDGLYPQLSQQSQ